MFLSTGAMRSSRQLVAASAITSSSSSTAACAPRASRSAIARISRVPVAHLPERPVDAVDRLAGDLPLVEHLERALAGLGPLAHQALRRRVAARRGPPARGRGRPRCRSRSPQRAHEHAPPRAPPPRPCCRARPRAGQRPGVPRRHGQHAEADRHAGLARDRGEPGRRLPGDVLVVVGLAADHRAEGHDRVEAPERAAACAASGSSKAPGTVDTGHVRGAPPISRSASRAPRDEAVHDARALKAERSAARRAAPARRTAARGGLLHLPWNSRPAASRGRPWCLPSCLRSRR